MSEYQVIMIPVEKEEKQLVFSDYDVGGCAVMLFQIGFILAVICVIIWALVTLL